MSQENVELIRSLFAKLESDQVQGVLELFDPHVTWSPTEGGTYRGVEGVSAHFIEWMEPWESHKVEVEECIEGSDDRVLATIHITARGGSSGMEIDQHFFQVYTVQGGAIVSMVEYVDRAPALEAVGLSNQPRADR